MPPPGIPSDRRYIIYATMIFHGLGTLIAWNMFIIAKSYFVDYKLLGTSELASNYLAYVGWAAQFPNLVFSWLNVFINLKGDLVTRILGSLFFEVMMFVFTIILAMVDSSGWPVAFFWITMISVFILNSLNAVYQNSVFGIAAPLPSTYIGGVVLGQNLCGTIIVLLNWVTDLFGGSYRTSAIYFFIFGMLILIVCFDTFLVLPFNRFYRYYQKMHDKKANASVSQEEQKVPYGFILKQARFQIYNIFSVYFVSLAIFPALHSDIKAVTNGFLGKNFARLTCFFTFNFTAMIGNITASIWRFPNSRWLIVFSTVRYLFIPFFLMCNYHPLGRKRFAPVLINSDWVYWIGAALMGWSSGHGSSLGMMYIGGTVAPEYAPKAGMIGGACIMTGIMFGLAFTRLCPLFISS